MYRYKFFLSFSRKHFKVYERITFSSVRRLLRYAHAHNLMYTYTNQ